MFCKELFCKMKLKICLIGILFFLLPAKGSNGTLRSILTNPIIETIERPWLDYKWVVEEINGQPIDNGSEEKINLRIKPLVNTFSGFLGCNQMGGKLYVEENKIRFKNVVATSMDCNETQTEMLLLNTLMTITNFGIIEDRLYLSNYEGIKMVLVRSN